MKFWKKAGAFALALSLFLLSVACSSAPNGEQPPKDVPGGNSAVGGSSAVAGDSTPQTEIDTSFEQKSEEMFTERDLRREYDEGVLISLEGDRARCESTDVRIDGSTVTLSAEGSYTLRGTWNGCIVVNAPDAAKLQIVLDGVTMVNPNGAAICILQCDKVFLLTAPGSVNTLTCEAAFGTLDGKNVDGAIFSKQDLTLGGEGTLTVISAAHGIVGKDDIAITGGTYTVTAASHGIEANDSVRVTEATLTVTAGKDALHIENTDDDTRGFFYMESGVLTATTGGDGIDAGAYIHMTGGTVSLTTGGGYTNGEEHATDMGDRPGRWEDFFSSSESATTVSAKGIKADGTLLIAGGTFTLDCADDAIHSNTAVVVRGGTMTLATGDDGIHADEALLVSGGTVVITASYEGLEALHIEICGGDISMQCTDDGINAAGSSDSNSNGRLGGGNFGRPDGKPDDMPGGMPNGRPDGGEGFPGNMGGMGHMGGMEDSNGTILISGGSIYIQASGDGIDANGTLTICGGLVVVCGPTQGDTAVLDYDKTGVITGGTFVGTGANNGMAQTFSDAEQGLITLRVDHQSADTPIRLCDSEGNVLISIQPAMPFALVIISTPEMVKGQSYMIDIGGKTETVVAY